MRLKLSVRADHLQPQLVLGLMVADSIFRRYEVELVITSLNDGVHGSKSKHYEGAGGDLRTKHIVGPERKTTIENILADMRDALGPDFDIVLEHFGEENEHIHMEWDPKLAPTQA